MKYFGSILLIFLFFDSSAQDIFSDQSNLAGISNLGANYGISVADYDNDGDEDFYVTRLDDRNLLYQNNGEGRFSNVAAAAGVDYPGYTFMAVWGDIDNDHDLDLYLANNQGESNVLYLNNGDGTFSDITQEAGVDELNKTRSVLMADVDNDGFLDIYLANLVAENSLFHNNGDGTFTNIIGSSRATDRQIAMGAIFFDYDNDNDQDLYLTHDDYQANILYRNDGNNKFKDVSEEAGVAYEGLGMGVDAADFNNDGFMDLYVTNMLKNVLYLNNGDGTFTDISESAGVDDDGMGWGTTWIDFDNDGKKDLYLSNDSDFFPNPNILYQNNGEMVFSIVSDNSVVNSPNEGYATACADFDNNGWPDLLVANLDTQNQLFINEGSGKNWIKVRLAGTESNAYAVGARVEIHTSEEILVDEVTTGSGYSSQNSFTLHFGLDDHASVDQLVIRWPSGLTETFEELEANHYYVVKEDRWIRYEEDSRLTPNFIDVSDLSGIAAPGSNNGVSLADYDNDGDEDIYISRLANFSNLLFENRGNGNFTEVSGLAGLAFDGSTVVSCWGDINNDGLKDLYLGIHKDNDRLYLNNGDKTFTDITADARINNDLKPNSLNMADVDNDGDLDIYVANLIGQNILYRNNGDNTFTNVIQSSGALDTNIAMGSIFFDYDNDKDQDLLLTNDGFDEYVMYRNDGSGRFTDVSAETGLNYPGQAMGVDVADYNNDGFMDVYVTNLLENVLFENNGDGTFSNVSSFAGIEDPGMGWGIVWVDYNNDGRQDIYIANDSNFSPYSNKLYHNKGNGEFIEISQDSPLYSFYGGYGSAIADFDNNGTQDIFLANLNGIGNQLFMNQNLENNWIKIRLKGTSSNADAVGARVKLTVGEMEFIDEVHAGSSYASQSSGVIHFGLGSETRADQVQVTWPGGFDETYEDLEVNQYYEIIEDESLGLVNIVTSIEDDLRRSAYRIYPNPFRTTLNFSLPLKTSGEVRLSIEDLSGRTVALVLNEKMGAGNHELRYNASGLRNGIYIVTLEVDGTVFRKKLMKD